MSVRENLIKAKGLINTPEKFAALNKSSLEAINRSAGRGTIANQECIRAMRNARGLVGTDWTCHREVMDHFSRAIEASE